MLGSVQQFASLSGIWPLVRMTLLVGTLILASSWHVVNNLLLTDDTSQSVSYLEKLSLLFMNIGRSAPRYFSSIRDRGLLRHIFANDSLLWFVYAIKSRTLHTTPREESQTLTHSRFAKWPSFVPVLEAP